MNDFWEHFLGIFLDPAHFAAEVTFTVLIDGIILGLLWPLVRRAIKREHLVIDDEHGRPHYGSHVEEPGDWRANLQPPYPDIPVPYVLTDKGKVASSG